MRRWFLLGGLLISLACGGGSSNVGDALTLTPSSAVLPPRGAQQFSAIKGSDPALVIWSTTMGTIDLDGMFSAPDLLGAAIVTAKLRTDPAQLGHATVTLQITKTVQVELNNQSSRTVTMSLVQSTGEFTVAPGETKFTSVQKTWSAEDQLQAFSARVVDKAGPILVAPLDVSGTESRDPGFHGVRAVFDGTSLTIVKI